MSMREVARWHGTPQELQRLLAAVERHCECSAGLFGRGEPSCPSHAMLQDELVLGHLLYIYRIAERFQRAEWSTDFGAAGVTPSGRWPP